MDPGYIYLIQHMIMIKNKTDIFWMTSHVRDNFERFGNYISINIMHLSICNAKVFYDIAHVIKNEIRKINCECEGFIISETYDAYIFVLDSFFKMCPHRKKGLCNIFKLIHDKIHN